MLNRTLKARVDRELLPRVQTPGQYIGGELNAVVKDHRTLLGKLCLAYPDLYTIGMSCHGLQVLYAVMNRRADWACERAFTPMPDMQSLLRAERLPLFSLETFTPLGNFDVLGFTLQHELTYTNVLAMLDLAGIPLRAEQRGMQHPLVIAGGPGALNPEPMAPFIDLFVLGDGEYSLPEVCDAWLAERQSLDEGQRGAVPPGNPAVAVAWPEPATDAQRAQRASALARLAARLPFVYVPRFYQSQYAADGRPLPLLPLREDVPRRIRCARVDDLEAVPIPTSPVVPFVECVQDRISIEIMRGCPHRCRFCQSSAAKRPVRLRKVETIVRAAQEAYRNTGYNEISLLSLSSSDYPYFDDLIRHLQDVFRPLHVAVSLPSLRINEQLRYVGELLTTERHSGLTLAPEAALDDMRLRLGKRIRNEDLLEGCRRAMEHGYHRVKLYFMCGLPGERPEDLDGIIDMAEHIAQLGRQVRGRPATVVANVSNFVPKPHTPYQWYPMQRREYFVEAHRRLRRRKRLRSVELRCHDVETSLLEGVLSRGDRRVGKAIELAYRRGARLDAWREHFKADLWWQSLRDAGVDVEQILHRPYAPSDWLPWDHIVLHQDRCYLEQEWQRATALEPSRSAVAPPMQHT